MSLIFSLPGLQQGQFDQDTTLCPRHLGLPPAVLDVVGLLARMNKIVCLKITSLREGLVANGTGVGLLVCMNQNVPLQISSLGEGLVANVTGVRLLVCVN